MKRIIINKHLLLLVFLFSTIYTDAQRMTISFGNINPSDFSPAAYTIDSSADAVYLFDGGYVHLVQNYGYYFTTQFTRHARVRLLKQKGFADPTNDLATIKLSTIVSPDYKEQITDFHAAVYNIENGKVINQNFNKSDLLKDKELKTRDGSIVEYKFTFPNLKEGSIIEYSYTINYPENEILPAWDFQNDYPCLWSEYEVTYPKFYSYLITLKGLLKYDFDTSISYYSSYNLADFNVDSANTINSVWAIKNVKPLKKEPYISNLSNYISQISLRLYAVKREDRLIPVLSGTWKQKAYNLLHDEDFGLDLSIPNKPMDEELKIQTAGIADSLDKAKKIYEYVRNNFSAADDDDEIYLSQPLSDVFKNKKGNIADINLLLTAIYLSEGYDAKPIILSTKEHGWAPQIYPQMSNFNYVITNLNIDGKDYYLDASDKLLSFNHLHENCYNGGARIIDNNCSLISFSSDSLIETKITSVLISNNDNGMMANLTVYPGYYETHDLRQQLEHSKEDDYFLSKKKEMPFDVTLTNTSFDSLQNSDAPLVIKYSFRFQNDDDIFYFNPFLSEAIKENPFKSAERIYPVEMPYKTNQTYVLNMEIPKGYVIDDLPKSAKVALNDTEGIFEYIIGKTDAGIQLRCRLVLNKANFSPEDYQTLRDFYSFIVEKEGEQIVLKKVK